MKTDSIVLIMIFIVAFFGIMFLYKGPGLAVQSPIRTAEYDVAIDPIEMPTGRACVCNDLVNEQQQVLPLGKAGSIYDCRSMCTDKGWQFVELRQ